MRVRWGAAALAFAVFCAAAIAQQSERKAFDLRGTVEAVDTAAQRLRVSNEPIPGGMGGMTMNYKVDRPEVLSQVKAGDRITAKYYEGDLTLHDVRILPQARASGSGDTPGLRLEELEKIALENNPTVAQAAANVRAATGLARQSGLYPNPTVGYYGDEIRGGYTGGGKQGAFVSQTIVTGGKLRAARRVAELSARETATSGETQRLRILNDVRGMFYQVLAAQRLVEVRQKQAKWAEDAAQTSRQLANIGQADRPDVLQSEIEQQQTLAALHVAERNLQSMWRALAAVMGKPDLPPARLEGDLEAIPDLNYEEWLAAALNGSPEVKIAGQGVERAEAFLAQARKAAIPDLQLYGNLSQNNEPLETTHRPIGLNGGVQIGVQVPLFNRNQANVAAALGMVESARQELVRVKLRLTRDMANLFRDYESARTMVDQYKTGMLPRAEQAYRLYLASYQNMAAGYPQALISQRTLFQLEADYVQALRGAWESAIEIRGFGLADGLAAPGGERAIR